MNEPRTLIFLLCTLAVSILPSIASASVVIGHSNTTALSSGLVGYWPFDGKYTHWNTNTTDDASGNGNTGTLVSMSTTTSPVPGKIGGALKFNGSSQYIKAPGSFSFNTVSVSAWVKFPSLPGGYYTIAIRDDVNTNWGVLLRQTGAHPTFSTVTNATNYTLTGNTTSSTNTWYHIVGTYDGAKQRLYVNGVEDSASPISVTGALRGAGSQYTFGADGLGGGTGLLTGTIDDVRIYNRALSAQEVQQLYASGAANVAHSNTTALSSGLVGYWPFDGKYTHWNTNTTDDASGNGNTGTLVSMSTTTSPVPGKIGGALKFNGSSHVTVANNASLNPGAVTVSAWIKGSNFPNSYNTIVQHGSGQNFYEYFVRNTGKVAVYVAVGGSGPNYDATETYTLSAGKWYHVAFTYDSVNGIKGYVNGSLDGMAGTSRGAMTSVSASLGIGNDLVTAGRLFNGTIDDVRIYNRALSAQEIAQLYALGK